MHMGTQHMNSSLLPSCFWVPFLAGNAYILDGALSDSSSGNMNHTDRWT